MIQESCLTVLKNTYRQAQRTELWLVLLVMLVMAVAGWRWRWW